MNDTHEWLRKGVLDLAIMLRGLDADLDSALADLKETLKQREELDLEEFKVALEKTDQRFDELETVGEQGTRQLYSLYRTLIDLNESPAPTIFRDSVEAPGDHLFPALALLDQALLLVPGELPADNSDDATLIRLRQKLCSRFITLLRTLAILGDEDGTLSDLAQKLEVIPDWSALDTLASDAIALIHTRLNAEKGQFEYYLNQLNEKLRIINELITADHHSVETLSNLSLNLDKKVDDQLSKARQEIQEAVSIEQLRRTLNLSLDGLLSMLNEFQQQTRASLTAMNKRQSSLNEQLQSLQADNHKLIRQVALERELSMRDPLTQLPNRQGFELRLKEEMARSIRYNKVLSLALIDIDHFKRINDQFGHLAGDKVLKILAKEMKSQLRESDYLARFGGEEFVLILPETDHANGLAALNKMRRHVSECPFHFQGKPVQITFSAGLAEYQETESFDYWLNRADEALYQSKHDGRNRISLASTA